MEDLINKQPTNYIILAWFVLMFLFMAPFLVSAHGGGGDNLDTQYRMMEQIEERSLGGDMHTEMEELMEQMIAGTLSDEGVERMVEIMQENPGPHGMMMNRMNMMNDSYGSMSNIGYGHMFGYGGNFMGWIWWLTIIVWLIAGVLVINRFKRKDNE